MSIPTKALVLALKIIEPFQDKIIEQQAIRSVFRKIYTIASLNVYRWILTEIGGVRIYINTRDVGLLRSFIIKKKYEEGTTKVFKDVLRKGITIIDIGAGIGYYSLVASRIVGEGKVFAFEPHPANFEWLVRNITFNNSNNVIPVNKAVSNKNGSTRLFISKDNISHHSIVLSENRDYVEVDTIALDSFFEESRVLPDVVKMDVEGAEILAVKGMERTIRRSKDLVMFVEYEYNKEELSNFLSRYFDIYRVTKMGELIPFDEARKRKKKDFDTNLFCVRKK